MLGKTYDFLRKWAALAVIVVAYLFSAYKVLSYRPVETTGDTITLRLGHWQLEAGVREAFDQLAEDYRREVNPKVRIIQDAIPESTYGQWITSQMMGQTAPDIVECGNSLPDSVWLSYYNRYFIPLTRLAARPNPYNADNELANTPLRDTLAGGMRSGYVTELGEFVTMPLSQFNSRVFVNLDLLSQLTGSSEMPKDFQSFKRMCAQIRTNQYAPGKPYVPIVGSAYHFSLWTSLMADPLTYGLLSKADFNRDGTVGTDENFVAFKSGLVTFHSPELVARFKMISQLADLCQHGFTGLTRDEGLFLFAQGHAAFISSGTWDARSIFEQAEGKFKVGIMPFPFPTRDDPEFGSLISGPAYESANNGLRLGVTRFSKHPEIATDFLAFLASRKHNGRFNQIAGWIPAANGAPVPAALSAFQPHLEGMYDAFQPTIGGSTLIRWNQLNAEYLIGQISYDNLATSYTDYYLGQGLADLREQNRDWRRSAMAAERLLAGFRGKALTANSPQDAAASWARYRAIFRGRVVGTEVWHNLLLRLVSDETAVVAAPYEYSPQVLARVRARILAESPASKAIRRPQ